MSAAKPLLQAFGLTVSYGGVAALCEVDLEVYAGEVVAVIGPNGAGKSTLLSALSGHAGAVSGRLEVDGRVVGASRGQRALAALWVLLTALACAGLSANPERAWQVAINDTFRLHCAGGDTRGCHGDWGDVRRNAWGHLLGGPTLGPALEPTEAGNAAVLRQPNAAPAAYPSLAAARAALPAAWERAWRGPDATVPKALATRAAWAALGALAALGVAVRAVRASTHAAHLLARAGVARTFQNLRVFASMSVADNVRVGAAQAGGRGKATRTDGAAAREAQVAALLHQVQLSALADVPAHALAYGEMRRLELARALALRPKVLLLDEPVAGMNAQETRQVLHLLREVRAQGTAVVLIEHDMPLVMGVSDRVVVLDQGRKIAEGTPQQVRQDPRVIRAYLGASSVDDQVAAVVVASDEEGAAC